MDTRRDFIYVEDLIDLVEQAIDGAGASGVYHASSGSDYSIKELFDATVAALGTRPAPEVEVRDREPGRRVHDPARPEPNPGRIRLDARRRRSGRASRTAIDYYREFGIEETYTHLKLEPQKQPAAVSSLRRHDASSSSAARGSSAATSFASCSTASARAGRRRRQLPLRRARERSRGRAGRAHRGLDRRRRRARRDRGRVRLRLPPRHLPRQPELDRGPARRPRAQPDHDAEALRAAEGLRAAAEGRLRGIRLHARPAHLRRGARRSTEDGPVPLDLDSPYQISKVVGEFYAVYYHSRHGCRPCARASRTSTARARSSARGSGAGRPRRCGGTSRRRSSTARSGTAAQLDNGGLRVARLHLRRATSCAG